MRFVRHKISKESALCLSIIILSISTITLYVRKIVKAELAFLAVKPSKPTLRNKGWQPVAINIGPRTNLSAWFGASMNGATVIFLHGIGGNKAQFEHEATFLHDQGFGVLLYDARGHGESGGSSIGYGDQEAHDLKSVVNWLIDVKNVDTKKVGALGFSVGGLALLKFAANDSRLSSIVLSGTPASVLDLAADEGGPLGSLTAPIKLWAIEHGKGGGMINAKLALKEMKPLSLLFVYGSADKTVPLSRGRDLYSAAKYPKHLAIFPNADHDEIFSSDRERSRALLLQHFSDSLLARSCNRWNHKFIPYLIQGAGECVL